MSQAQMNRIANGNNGAAKARSANHSTISPARVAGTHAPVLDSALLHCVQQLNLDYLQLMAAEPAAKECANQLHHLMPPQRAAVRALSARALRCIANAPYTMYSLGFEDESFWDAMRLQTSVATPESVIDRYARSDDESAQYAFCKLALTYAWHFAATNPFAARVVYAMSYSTAQRLAATPLWHLTSVATSHAALLAPRWPTNPAFWPDLIRFAAADDPRRLANARLLGTQLIAAELEVMCALSRRSARSFPSPRLRARRSRER